MDAPHQVRRAGKAHRRSGERMVARALRGLQVVGIGGEQQEGDEADHAEQHEHQDGAQREGRGGAFAAHRHAPGSAKSP
ncbi:hypothetical protein JMG10_34740 [Nostoc ellipsosporum NOK]|nr:hypothetical protein [Nostoc ellipsosporum NOK]